MVELYIGIAGEVFVKALDLSYLHMGTALHTQIHFQCILGYRCTKMNHENSHRWQTDDKNISLYRTRLCLLSKQDQYKRIKHGLKIIFISKRLSNEKTVNDLRRYVHAVFLFF